MKAGTVALPIALFLVAPYTSVAQDDHLTRGRLNTTGPYAVEHVASAAFGVDMNDAGLIIGSSYPDTGCGSTCLPPLETVLWRDGQRVVLPPVPGLSGIVLTGVNNHGWVVGSAGMPSQAVLWKPEVQPSGDTRYRAINLGTLPGRNTSTAVGIDDLGRVVGWSTTSTFPPNGAPFLWTEAGGMEDLADMGFPNEAPLGISPAGTVGTLGYWYRLGQLQSVTPLPPPPAGYALENSLVAINDAGDQARFLVTAAHPYLDYPFRYHHEGLWQQISAVPTGHLSTYAVGSITGLRDITLTVAGVGMIARGPTGVAQPISPLVSSSYAGGIVTAAGPINTRGEILARMMIRRSARLIRLVPGRACTSDCIIVNSLQLEGSGPPYCDQGQNQVRIRLSVTNELGVPLGGVRVTLHVLDDYWMDRIMVGFTDGAGRSVIDHTGPACVGAIAALVSDATSTIDKRTLDRTVGTLVGDIIPLSRQPDPPAAVPSQNAPVHVVGSFMPNPATTSTTLRFSVNEPVPVTLVLYNALGSEVARFARNVTPAGSHEMHVNTAGLSNGVYLARFVAGSAFQQTIRLVIAR